MNKDGCIACGGGFNFASPEEIELIKGMPHCTARQFLHAKRTAEWKYAPAVIAADFTVE